MEAIRGGSREFRPVSSLRSTLIITAVLAIGYWISIRAADPLRRSLRWTTGSPEAAEGTLWVGRFGALAVLYLVAAWALLVR